MLITAGFEGTVLQCWGNDDEEMLVKMPLGIGRALAADMYALSLIEGETEDQ